MKREEAELLVTIGFSYQLTPEELTQVRYCRTSKPNSNCQYSLLGCKHCSEYQQGKSKIKLVSNNDFKGG